MISLVIPTFNSSASLPELISRIGHTFDKYSDYEILLVDDNSSDDTWQIINDTCLINDKVRGFRLSRNFGQHNALLCGIRQAKGSLIVTLDDDLQHSPESVPKLIKMLNDGYDVIYGSPSNEAHSFSRYLSSRITKFALQKTMGASVASQISALRAFKTDLRDAFKNFDGPNVNVDVLLTWATTRFSTVKVPHLPRLYGKSGYSTLKLIQHAMNMMTGFTTRPLKLATLIGFLFSLFGLVIFIYVVIRWLAEGSIVPGFPFLASIISIFSGAQLVALGIIGEYLSRMHVSSTKQPSFLIAEKTKVSKLDT